jgi:hypothetical protein
LMQSREWSIRICCHLRLSLSTFWDWLGHVRYGCLNISEVQRRYYFYIFPTKRGISRPRKKNSW